MKVLGILGGANRDGNTAKLVAEVLTGAKEAGHETVIIRLVDEKIDHIGYSKGESTFPRDDFEEIKPHLETMGAIIIGAPICTAPSTPALTLSSSASTTTAATTARRTERDCRKASRL